jgi:hypothetical protein
MILVLFGCFLTRSVPLEGRGTVLAAYRLELVTGIYQKETVPHRKREAGREGAVWCVFG